MNVDLETKSTDVRCDQGHEATIPQCLGDGFSGYIQVTDGRRRDLVVECGDGSPLQDITRLVEDIIDELEEHAPTSERLKKFRAVQYYVPNDLIPVAYDAAPSGYPVSRVSRRTSPSPCCPQCGSTELETLAVRRYEEATYFIVRSSHWAEIKYRDRRNLAEQSLERIAAERHLSFSDGIDR